MKSYTSSTKVNIHYLNEYRSYAEHDLTRSEFQDIYAELLSLEKSLSGHVLDIGCGHGTNPTIEKIKHQLVNVDGVDPFPIQEPHPLIKRRWVCKLEDIPIPDSTYDLAYSYNVVEHVSDVDSFLTKTVNLLKPGGIYWSMSPNYDHPFASAVRLMQALRLKKIYRRLFAPQVNDYPAYYRMCRASFLLSAIRNNGLPVKRLDLYYVHNVQWETFFPIGLKFIPRAIDKLYTLRRPDCANIFMFRLEKY